MEVIPTKVEHGNGCLEMEKWSSIIVLLVDEKLWEVTFHYLVSGLGDGSWLCNVIEVIT